jgi:hypothetical protein
MQTKLDFFTRAETAELTARTPDRVTRLSALAPDAHFVKPHRS